MADQSSIKGSWSMSPENPIDVLGDDETIDNNDIVMMLQLRHGHHMKAGATSFSEAFNRDDVEQVYAEASLQMLFKVLTDLKLLVGENTSENADLKGMPFEVCVETVLRGRPSSPATSFSALPASHRRTTTSR